MVQYNTYIIILAASSTSDTKFSVLWPADPLVSLIKFECLRFFLNWTTILQHRYCVVVFVTTDVIMILRSWQLIINVIAGYTVQWYSTDCTLYTECTVILYDDTVRWYGTVIWYRDTVLFNVFVLYPAATPSCASSINMRRAPGEDFVTYIYLLIQLLN